MTTYAARKTPNDLAGSGWYELLPPPGPARVLDEAIDADWVIIGAGFAGLAAARRLTQLRRGERVVLLDAQRVGWGSAGRNSGFMIDLPHELNSETYAGGVEHDLKQIRMNRAAIDYTREAVEEYDLQAFFSACGKYNIAADSSGVKALEAYSRHLDALNEPYTRLDAAAVRRLTGTDYYAGGIHTPGTALIQPAGYVRGLAAALEDRIAIYESSPVLRIETGARHVVHTSRGRVTAERVILTNNGHAESFGLYRRRLLHVFTFASMTRALSPEERHRLGGEREWGLIPAAPMGTTLRRIGDRLVVRNTFTYNPGMATSERQIERIGRKHDRAFRERFPMLADTAMQYRWGGHLCLSLNSVPAFGEVEQRLYTAVCQNGLGTVKGTLAGMLIVDHATRSNHPLLPDMLACEPPARLYPEPFMTWGHAARCGGNSNAPAGICKWVYTRRMLTIIRHVLRRGRALIASGIAGGSSTARPPPSDPPQPRKPTMTKPLKGISDIRRHFHRNERPMFFISATNFNLLGMDEWVRGFRYINYIDCYDGKHPNVFVPEEIPHPEFESIEDINNYLLEHKSVIDYIKAQGENPVAVFLMFDETTEALAREIGLEVWFPPAALRNRCDNKMETVRIGNKAGVPSVPNALSRVESYAHLRQLCAEHGLGDDVVIQTAFGDSGHTTFFIGNETDWHKHADEIVREPEVKLMKRINCRGSTLEACTTRQGTIVGPLLTEVVGARELTPYKGGWCGNEVLADAFGQDIRDRARDYAFAFGEQLRQEGYRGYFDLDFLIDQDSGELYLGELNPRVTGASSMTNHAAFAHADAPLFLFHLLEFSGVDFEFDVDDLNARWSDPDYIDSWCQLVIKHTEDSVDIVAEAPSTGIWRMTDSGAIEYSRFDYHRRAVNDEQEAFFLRITGPGDYRYEGADLGILILRGRAMTGEFRLNDRAQAWIRGILSQYRARPLPTAQVEAAPSAGAYKIL